MSPRIAERVRRRLLGLAIALSVCFAGTAQAGDKALAESLFESGRQLMDEGKFAEACDKFQSSNDEDPSPGALINLAGCQEKLGKTASAWANSN